MAQEVTIKGKTIPKSVIGSGGAYNYIPYTTAILDGTRIVPGTSSNIKVGLEITESDYNQLRNNPSYESLLTTVNGTRIVNVGELDSKGNFISSPYVNNTDQNSKNIINELRNGSQFTNSINEEIQRLGYANGLNIDQNSATQQPSVEQSNTSAANPVDTGTGTATGTGTGGTPTTGTATSGPATGTPPGGTGANTGTTGTPVGGVTRGQATLTDNKVTRSKGPGYIVYPADMDEKQDKIKFTIWQSKKQIGGEAGSLIGQLDTSFRSNTNSYDPTSLYDPPTGLKTERTVYLPITKISDTNAVDWVDDKMNALQLELAKLSLSVMMPTNEGQTRTPVDRINSLLSMAGTPEFGNAVRLYLASEAVSANGLLTRATGGIFNPNLELLFNGPQLRSFQFNVGMISKNNEDATNIKKIINYFKTNMAVKTNPSNNLFLTSPFVFQIEYLAGQSTHQSLNKIKMCALQACNVDYTPMGSYMTFADTTNTMFMYTMALQFKELHPIYDVDYLDGHPIGY